MESQQYRISEPSDSRLLTQQLSRVNSQDQELLVTYYVHPQLPFSLYGADGVPDLDRSCLSKALPGKELPAAKKWTSSTNRV
jgi:hypothetical protein